MYNFLSMIGTSDLVMIMPILFWSLVLFFIFSRRKGISSPLVIKTWRASDIADTEGHYVVISGRAAGISTWLLSLMNVDATFSMKVNAERIEFEETSLSGYHKHLIPLRNVCSTDSGYAKPWKQAVLLCIFICFPILFFLFTASDSGSRGCSAIVPLFFSMLLSLLVSFLYYLLKRHFDIGFIEHSGERSGFCFKRSVIENQEINEVQANYVTQLIQALIDHSQTKKS